MEFLTPLAFYRLVRSAKWTMKDVYHAIETGQLAALKIVTPGGTEKWAIVHPGVQFLDYLRNVHTRMGYVPLLGPKEVAAITGHTEAHVRWLAHKRRIHSIHLPGKKQQGLRFSPEDVRDYLIRSTGTDPRPRAQMTSEVLIQWYNRCMTPRTADPVEQFNDELSWLNEMPEPERSLKVQEMLRLAEEAKEKITKGRATPAD